MKTLLILSSVSSLPKGTGYTQDIKELAEELTQQSKAELKKELESLPTFKFHLHNSQTSSFFDHEQTFPHISMNKPIISRPNIN